MGKLDGKVAVITGGSSRIGLASAIFHLASEESSFTAGIDLVADGGLSDF